MVRTERFRGRLLAGNDVVLDSVEGLLKTLPRGGRGANGVGEWTGHFEVPPQVPESLVDGHRYRLVLIDGRSGHVHLHLTTQSELHEKPLAKFHGTGTCRN